MNSKILFNSPDFEKPKPELEQYSTPPDIAITTLVFFLGLFIPSELII